MDIYVGNFGYDVTEDEIKAAFQAYGEVESVKIIIDRDSGRSKGFGFVGMADDSEAQAAIDGLNGKELGGREITVNESKPKPKSNNRGGGFGGGQRSGGGGSRSGGGFGGGGRGRY